MSRPAARIIRSWKFAWVAEAAGNAAAEFDDAVDRFGVVSGSAGGEVGRNSFRQVRRVRPSLAGVLRGINPRGNLN